MAQILVPYPSTTSTGSGSGSGTATAAADTGTWNFLFFTNADHELQYWRFKDTNNPGQYTVEAGSRPVKVGHGGISAIYTDQGAYKGIRVYIVGSSGCLEEWCLDHPDNDDSEWYSGGLSSKEFRTAVGSLVHAIPSPLKVIFQAEDDDVHYHAAQWTHEWSDTTLSRFRIPK